MAKTPDEQRAYLRAYYLKNRERAKGVARAYYYENREGILEKKRAAAKTPESREQQRVYRASRRDIERAQQRRRLGIIDPPGHLGAGVCPICLVDGALVLDHDHATGAIRGWLCDPCNRGLGILGDTREAIERLLRYLTPA